MIQVFRFCQLLPDIASDCQIIAIINIFNILSCLHDSMPFADIFHTNLTLFSAVSQFALLRLQEVACTEEGRGLEVAYL